MSGELKTLVRLGVTLALLATQSLQGQAQEQEQVEIPAELEAKLAGLSAEEREFLTSEDALFFAIRPTRLFEQLSNMSAEHIAAYVQGMMFVVDQSRFNPEEDMDSIPLVTDDPLFNAFQTPVPNDMNPPRQPGPINLNRYMMAGAKLGIPTFFNSPVALTPEDLEAGGVEVALMGAGLDMSFGMRGAAYGPRAVRTGQIYSEAGPVTPEHMHTMVSPFNELTIVDYGDIGVDQFNHERSVGHIREMVRQVAATGAIPMIVGGDHTLMYPDVAGVVDVYGAGNVGVVHFDAHYDAGQDGSHLINHGMPVWRLFNEGLVPGENFIQVGLRGFWPSRAGFEWMQENGLRYHTMAEIEQKGWDAVMERAIQEAKDGPEYLFISFDVDVLDPAYMPGTGTPEPGGLTPREAFPIVRRLCAETNVIGFELVEVNPLADPGYTTAQNSDRILRECLTGIAMRKLGLTEEHYLSPLTTEHGHDQ